MLLKLVWDEVLWDNYSRRNAPDGLLVKAAWKLPEEKKVKFWFKRLTAVMPNDTLSGVLREAVLVYCGEYSVQGELPNPEGKGRVFLCAYWFWSLITELLINH